MKISDQTIDAWRLLCEPGNGAHGIGSSTVTVMLKIALLQAIDELIQARQEAQRRGAEIADTWSAICITPDYGSLADAVAALKRQRDYALTVRDSAREASARDLEARRMSSDHAARVQAILHRRVDGEFATENKLLAAEAEVRRLQGIIDTWRKS